VSRIAEHVILELRDTVALLSKSCVDGYLPLEGTLILKRCIEKLYASGVELSEDEEVFVSNLKSLCDSILENSHDSQ